jgi:AraC-like DNA-binding protein
MLLTYDYHTIIKKILEKEFKRLDIAFDLLNLSEIRLKENLDLESYEAIKKSLADFGISVVEDPKDELVARIKESVQELIYSEESVSPLKMSIFLSEKLGYSYGYLSAIFTEATLISIENYMILKRIELVKLILLRKGSTVTDAANTLNYSSVSHLCHQFKKKTGLTPSDFQRIMSKRMASA